MKYFIDCNAPGATYVMDETISHAFVDHMTGEGACLLETDRVEAGDEKIIVTGVHHELGNWGLDCIYEPDED